LIFDSLKTFGDVRKATRRFSTTAQHEPASKRGEAALQRYSEAAAQQHSLAYIAVLPRPKK
jgi:hypothetical protein